MKIHDIIENSARLFPDNWLVIHDNRRLSFRELCAAARSFSEHLRQYQLARNSRVAILYENTIEYVVSYFAVFMADLVAVPLDNSQKPEKLNYIIADCRAEVLIVQGKFHRHLGEILGESTPIRFIITDKMPLRDMGINTTLYADIVASGTDTGENKRFEETGPDLSPELAAIFYTSGSTGEPKGVMLSHRNLIANTISTVTYLGLTSRDSVQVILPFYYIYGNSLLLTHALCGGTLVIDNRFLYPEVILDTMEREKVTGFSGVPSNFIILLNKSTFRQRRLADLRYMTQAGGSMAPAVIKELMSAFPEKKIYIMYGQTEAAPRVSYLPPDNLAGKIGSIGIPIPGVTMKILDEDGRELPPGESGELAISGDNVMLGYWNQEMATREVLKNGWLFTGDMAKMDNEGYYYITGRKREIIKSGGNRVSAKEIEECLLELDNVLEAAVIGVPDNLLGEAIKAFVVTRDGRPMDIKTIKAHCRTRIAEQKSPQIIEFVNTLPKYQSGKVNKPLLRSM